MLLAVDASRAATRNKTGIGWYAHHLLRAMRASRPDDVGVRLYSDVALPEALGPSGDQWAHVVLPWPPVDLSPYPFRWPLWSQVRLAERVVRDRPDVLFVPAHVIPFVLTLLPRAARPRLVTTIHDVAFRAFPETYSARERAYADHATRAAVRAADAIIVPTQVVADDLARVYGHARGTVAVIPHGVQQTNDAHDTPSATNDAPLVLYVGRLEHKKNVVRMVEAFDRIAGAHPTAELVLVGPDGYGAEVVHAAIARSRTRDRIATPGWVAPEEYHALLGRASVFLFPTIAEGFGMPILEAMAAGIPVITSSGGAHEEVAGNAARCVDPRDTDAIACAMEELLRNEVLRAMLRSRGIERARAFTWERTAAQTWHVIH